MPFLTESFLQLLQMAMDPPRFAITCWEIQFDCCIFFSFFFFWNYFMTKFSTNIVLIINSNANSRFSLGHARICNNLINLIGSHLFFKSCIKVTETFNTTWHLGARTFYQMQSNLMSYIMQLLTNLIILAHQFSPTFGQSCKMSLIWQLADKSTLV